MFPQRKFSPSVDLINPDTFDLRYRYNQLILSGEIEKNKEQERVFNSELHPFGEKILQHIQLLNEYKEYQNNESTASSATDPSQSVASAGGFWGFFSSTPQPELKRESRVPEKVVKELPEQFKGLEDLYGIYLHGNPGTGKTY